MVFANLVSVTAPFLISKKYMENKTFKIEDLVNFLSENEVSFDVPGCYALPKYIVIKALNEFIECGKSDLIDKHKKWTWGKWDIDYKKDGSCHCNSDFGIKEIEELLELKKYFNDNEDINFLNESLRQEKLKEKTRETYKFKRKIGFTKKLKDECFKRDNYKCVKCCSEFNLEVDHIIELIDGGDNNIDNLQVLCCNCHRKKTNKSIKNRK